MRSILVLLALVLALAVHTEASQNRHRLSGQRIASHNRVEIYNRLIAPDGWIRTHPAHPVEPISFTLAVKGQNAALLEQRFWAVSDPDSDVYGDFMTAAEIESLVAPSESELAIIQSTLASHGISGDSVVSHGDSFDVTCTIRQAERLFATEFFHYRHHTGEMVIRQHGAYSLPAELAEQVVMVFGVHTFPTTEQRIRMSEERKAKQAAIAATRATAPDQTPCWVPKAIAGIYGLPYPIAPLSSRAVSAGVIEWSSQTFSQSDLMNFSMAVDVPLVEVDDHRIVGNNSEVPYPGIEAELDIQWIEGVNPGFTPWFWLVSDPQQWMWSWTVQFLTATEYPSIVSLSYGLPEIDQCAFFDPSDCYGADYATYIHLVDKQFMKIGLIGVSIITATQDRGVYAPDPPASWRDNPRFTPEYPGSSAYVTSVGATEYINPEFNLPNPPPACNSTEWSCISGGSDEESVSQAISGFLSSGGFSDVDPRPSYQNTAVLNYFNSGVMLPNYTLWNQSGRGSPDVSAIGMNGYVIQQGYPELVSGASMSTPIVAGVMALIQADYQAITGTTLGFLNPMIYKAQEEGKGMFKDIVLGDNCGTPKCQGEQDGFSATKGWDAVSGLGSPYYPVMKAHVEELARKVVARRQRK